MNTNLKMARERFTSMSQKDVAIALGISESAYQKYEQGQRQLRGDVLIELARILNVSVDTILGTDYSALRDDDDFVSSDERQLIDAYRTLDEQDKLVLMRVAKALSK